MNPRERNLLMVLIAIVATAVSVYGGWQWFVVPLREYNAKIDELTEETDRLELQQAVFSKERKRLELGRLKSLPYKEADAQAEYEPYLKKVLQDNQLTYDSITKVAAAAKVKMASPIQGIKEPGHQTMQFTIHRAKGELKQIVSALDTIQRTPYEHRVKSMTIDRAQAAFAKTDRTLIVTLTLEVMLVARTENKVGEILGNSKLREAVRVPVGRDYAMINERNIFVGAEEIIEKNVLPPKKIPKDVIVWLPDTTPPKGKIDIEVWKYVRMTQTTPDQDEVHFRNIAYESPEFKVVANKKGYDTYRVLTEDKKHEFCNFKVLRVDLHQIYLQVRDQVHVMQFRQSLFDALQTPATERQLFWAGVKADTRWGEEEKSKAKAQQPPRKGGPKMRP